MVKFGWDKLKRFLAQANSWTGTQTFSSIAVTGGTISGAVITDQFTTSTNPASSAAVTTAIVDAYNGVVITTNVNNAQTIAAPTAATVKTFKVINNDTSSSAITVNGITLAAGKGQTFTYDGSAWGPTDIGITAIPVPVAEGGTGVSTSGALTEIPIGGGTTSPIVWTAATGTGAPVRATSPTLVTPLLGTPTSGVLTNATGLPLAGLVPGAAESDFICATTTPFTWVKKTLVEAKALLGLVITAGKTITATENTSLDEAVAMSSKAPKASPVFTGDVTLAGKVVNTTLPAFLVKPTAQQSAIAVNSQVTVVWGTEVVDQGANFATNTFTAPVTGLYQFSGLIYVNTLDSAGSYYQINLITTNRTYSWIYNVDGFSGDLTRWTFPFSILADMDLGETAYFTIFQAAGTQQTTIESSSYFSGHLVC